MCAKNQRWILPLSIGAFCLVSLSGVTQTQVQAQTPQVPTNALSPNDPRSRLDPSLLNVPAISPPQPSSSAAAASNPSQGVEVGFDIKTRTTKVGSVTSQSTSNPSSSSLSPPNFGVRTVITPEPRNAQPSSGGGVAPQVVIPPDQRVRINNTTTYPWRTITKLFITFPNGATGGCSGVLIGAKYVLTAGHCVYNSSAGGWASTIQVVPGLNGTYMPYGSAYATYMRSYTAWTQNQNLNYDLALITLDRNIGNTTGWLGYATYSSVNGLTGNIAGYPGDRDNGLGLYYHYGPILSSTAQLMFYQIDTFGGQSGSGIYRVVNQNRYVFGVHSGSSSGYNRGTRINRDKYDDLQRWISSGN